MVFYVNNPPQASSVVFCNPTVGTLIPTYKPLLAGANVSIIPGASGLTVINLAPASNPPANASTMTVSANRQRKSWSNTGLGSTAIEAMNTYVPVVSGIQSITAEHKAHISTTFATGASANAVAAVENSTVYPCTLSSLPALSITSAVGSASGERLWIGLASGDSSWTDLPANAVGFRLSGTAYAVLGNISVTPSTTPTDLAVNPTNSLLYVANAMSSGTISVIDTSINTLISTQNLGAFGSHIDPNAIVVNASGTKAYIACAIPLGNAYEVDLSTFAVTSIAVGNAGGDVALTPSGNILTVVNQLSNTLSIVSTLSNSATASVSVGNSPNGVAINPLGTFAYVTNTSDNTVSVVNLAAATVTHTISVGNFPYNIAINPAGTFAYVVNYLGGSISVINLATNLVTTTITLGAINPIDIVIDSTGTYAYTANAAGSVSIISLASNSVLATVNLSGDEPIALTLNNGGTQLYIADSTNNQVIDLSIQGDVHYMCYSGDSVGGGGAHGTVVDSGVLPDTEFHTFSVVAATSSSLNYFIDTTLVANITGTLPAPTLGLGPVLSLTSLTPSSINLHFDSMYLEHN